MSDRFSRSPIPLSPSGTRSDRKCAIGGVGNILFGFQYLGDDDRGDGGDTADRADRCEPIDQGESPSLRGISVHRDDSN